MLGTEIVAVGKFSNQNVVLQGGRGDVVVLRKLLDCALSNFWQIISKYFSGREDLGLKGFINNMKPVASPCLDRSPHIAAPRTTYLPTTGGTVEHD